MTLRKTPARRNTGVSREHAWNLIAATEHRPGDTEVVHECSYCGERRHGVERLPKLGCPVGPKHRD